MRLLAVLAVALLPTLALAAPVPKDKEKPTDAVTLLGRWQTISVEREGAKAPGDGVADRAYTFEKDGKLTLHVSRDHDVPLEYAIDSTASPKTIDLIVKVDAKTTTVIPGIYELDGDDLKLCLAEVVSAPRPKAMKAEGRGVGILTLKRVKEEKKDDKKEEKKDK